MTGVAKTFEQSRGHTVAALAEVELSIAAGEFVTILGPSGCGKSTLLSLVGGFDHPDVGQVLVDGEPVGPPGPDRAMVFQTPQLFPWLTALDNVAWPRTLGRWRGRRKRWAAARAHARELLDLVGLAPEAGQARPEQLSGGMRQRVALARALAMEPSILLLDEPFAALDALSREVLQGELRRIWREADADLTVLFVTHDIAEAVFLGDRVLTMSPSPGTITADLHVPLLAQRTEASRSAPVTAAVSAQLRTILRGHLDEPRVAIDLDISPQDEGGDVGAWPGGGVA